MAQKRKVLVIDDDIASCELIEQTMKSQGLEVMASRDARSGFEAARTRLPDLIFVSLLLPEINGLKVSKSIHSVEALKNVPIIMNVAQAGELDPKYTKTIGIVDILVKPFSAGEVIAKAKAVLGEDIVGSSVEGLTAMPFDEEEAEPAIELDMDEDIDTGAVAFTEDDREGAPDDEEHKSSRVPDAQGVREDEAHAGFTDRIQRFGQKEDVFNEQDLFSEVSDSSGDQTAPVRDESVQAPEQQDISDDVLDASYNSPPVSPVRRALMIAASIGAGIALGIVGYLFFTAGTQQTTARKQVTRVLPGPVAVAPSAPAAPADKPNIIPEIPVKQEQQAPGTAQTKEARIEEPSPAGAKNPEKKEVPHRQPAKEAVLKSGAADTAYYVQAGVFENRDNAVALAARIKEAGFAASIQNVDSAGRKRLFRVIAGSSTTREKAAELSASLSRKGIKTIVRTQ